MIFLEELAVVLERESWNNENLNRFQSELKIFSVGDAKLDSISSTDNLGRSNQQSRHYHKKLRPTRAKHQN
jgi:hypothetical protein